MNYRSICKELEEVKKIVDEIKIELELIKYGKAIHIDKCEHSNDNFDTTSSNRSLFDEQSNLPKVNEKSQKIVIRKKPVVKINL